MKQEEKPIDSQKLAFRNNQEKPFVITSIKKGVEEEFSPNKRLENFNNFAQNLKDSNE